MSIKPKVTTNLNTQATILVDMPEYLFFQSVTDDENSRSLRMTFDILRYDEAMKFLDTLSREIDAFRGDVLRKLG